MRGQETQVRPPPLQLDVPGFGICRAAMHACQGSWRGGNPSGDCLQYEGLDQGQLRQLSGAQPRRFADRASQIRRCLRKLQSPILSPVKQTQTLHDSFHQLGRHYQGTLQMKTKRSSQWLTDLMQTQSWQYDITIAKLCVAHHPYNNPLLPYPPQERLCIVVDDVWCS
jgi:hypothetical protein